MPSSNYPDVATSATASAFRSWSGYSLSTVSVFNFIMGKKSTFTKDEKALSKDVTVVGG